jgi:glutaredoxin
VRARGGSAPSSPRYQLLTRAGCHLCDDMARLLDDVLARRGLAYQSIDVDRDAALRDRYGESVPVLLRDGTAVAKLRADREQLERIVARRR